MRILFVGDVILKYLSSGSKQALYNQLLGLVREGREIRAIKRQDGAPSYLIFRNVSCVEEAFYSAPTNNIPHFFYTLLKEPSRLDSLLLKDGPFEHEFSHQLLMYFAFLVTAKMRAISLFYVFHSLLYEEYFLLRENRSFVGNYLPLKFAKS